MRIAFTGVGGTGKTTLARFVSDVWGWPISPVGARSTAAAMGFVGPDGTGRPFDVDRAPLGSYQYVLANGVDLDGTDKGDPIVAAREALRLAAEIERENGRFPTCRPLFQQRLTQGKVAWEQAHDDFVTDRTSLDDVAYALLHCPEMVTRAFLDAAIGHLARYDLVVFAPLSAGQWLGDDAARQGDADYYWRLEVQIRGLWDLANRELGSGQRSSSFPHRVELSSDDREARRACVLDEIPDEIRSLV